jgi:hypothetical protein
MSHGIFFCDSFEKWQNQTDHHGKWADSRLCETTTQYARSGNRSLYMPVGPYPRLIKPFPFFGANFCGAAGFRVSPSNITSKQITLLEFNSLGTMVGLFMSANEKWAATRLVVDSSYQLRVEVEASTTSSISRSLNTYPVGASISADKWYHIALEIGYTATIINEQYAFYSNARVYVNEEEFLVGGSAFTWLGEDDDNVLIRLAPTSCFVGRSYGQADMPFYSLWVDDFYLSETFAGDLEIDVIEPDGNSVNLWTPSAAGTNWETVKKTFPADTPYVGKLYEEPSTQEVCTMDDVNDIDEVVAIQGVLLGKKTYGSSAIVAPNYVQGSTEKGDDKYLGKDTICFTDLQELNPETEVEWTPVEVDNLVYGFSDEYPE